MALDFGDRRLPRKLAFRIWRRGNVGGFAGTILISLITALSAPVYLPAVSVRRVVPALLTIAPLVYAAGSACGLLATLFYVGRGCQWMLERREPNGTEVRRIAAFPRTGAAVVGGIWLVFIPFVVTLFVRSIGVGLPRQFLVIGVIAFVYSGLVAGMITFLLAEQVVRPILAHVLPADATTWPPALGTTHRLLLAWTLVSALPVSLVALNIGILTGPQRAVAGPSLVIACALVIVIGFAVFGVVGQSITGPLTVLRSGFKSVAEGDLGVEVLAADPGDLGLLQVGFNQMLEGLRDREHMRDVFGRHVGAEVARRAMEQEFGAGGDRCRATAMFVDIIGSTGLTQRREPEAVVAILNRFFDAVVRVVSDEGGFVNKFQGDGALCLFGTPLPVDDHAARALRAARALAAELAPMGDIAAAIGVSSGEVVAGNVGAADRYEYTVIGDAVNEASRLTDAAKTGTSRVLVSERTIHEAGAENNGWEPGERIQLRGRSEPTLTYAPATSV